MKIKKITYRNFRIYREVDFLIKQDKNIILLYGRNGTGKSSFFDGIEWGLTGKIDRYESSQTSTSELNKSSYILRNVFVSKKDESFVTIDFDDNNSIKRAIGNKYRANTDYCEGNYFGNRPSEFLIHENMKEINFEDNFKFSHLLAQEQISDFIRATDENKRYDTIVKLFGLDCYKCFDNHIAEFLKYLGFEIESIKQDIYKKQQLIEALKQKEQQLDIEPQVSKGRIEQWLQHEIKPDEINLLKNQLNTDYANTKGKIKIYQNDIQSLQNLQKRFKDIGETRIKISEFQNKFIYLGNIIEQLRCYTLFFQANQLRPFYENAIANSEEDDNILTRHSESINFLRDSNLFKTNASFEQQLQAISSVKPDINLEINSYLEYENQITKKKTTIKEIQDHISELSNASELLITSALQFFNKYPDLTECPICENKSFNISFTKSKLQNQLENSSNAAILATTKILEEEQMQIAGLEVKKLELKNTLLNNIESFKISFRKEINNLTEKAGRINENRKNQQKYLEILSQVNGAEPESTLNNYISTKKELENNPLFIVGKTEVQYNAELQNVKEEKDRLNNILAEFESLCQKYNTRTELEIDKKIEECNKEIEQLTSTIGQLESIQVDLSVVEITYSNKNISKQIAEHEYRIKELEIKLGSLQNIEKEYLDLKNAVKVTINNELDRKLELYRNTIQKVFKYLNPHIYMTNLELDFAPTGGNKGRLYINVNDPKNSKNLNPAYTFSAAQNNVLALSIFLSFALKQSWSKLDSIFLDDPIQNLDDINVHAFVDIIRSTIRNRPEKQFFISTHDDRVFNFMYNKFGPEKVQVFEFDGYGKIKCQTK